VGRKDGCTPPDQIPRQPADPLHIEMAGIVYRTGMGQLDDRHIDPLEEPAGRFPLPRVAGVGEGPPKVRPLWVKRYPYASRPK